MLIDLKSFSKPSSLKYMMLTSSYSLDLSRREGEDHKLLFCASWNAIDSHESNFRNDARNANKRKALPVFHKILKVSSQTFFSYLIAMALTAHHLEQSQSFRIVWLLEELKIPYELKLYQRSSTGYAPKDYKVLSPLGTAPCITDEVGDKKIVLCETNAIIDYILDKAEDNIETRAKAHQLRPSRAVGAAKSSQLQLRSNYLFWFHASTASFQSVMSIDSLVRILKQRTP